MRNMEINQKVKGSAHDFSRGALDVAMTTSVRSGREHFGDAMIDDHDSHVGHAFQLLRGFLVEGAECSLNAITHGESSRERDLSLVADFLPVVSGHQDVGERAAVNVVDVQEHYHRLVCGHAAFRQSVLEVHDTIGVQLERVAAVVLLHRVDHGYGVGIIQHQLAADPADDRAGVIVLFLLRFAHLLPPVLNVRLARNPRATGYWITIPVANEPSIVELVCQETVLVHLIWQSAADNVLTIYPIGDKSESE